MSELSYKITNGAYSRYLRSSQVVWWLEQLSAKYDLTGVYFCLEDEIKVMFFGSDKDQWICSKLQDRLIEEIKKQDKNRKFPQLLNLTNENSVKTESVDLCRGWSLNGIWGAVQIVCDTGYYCSQENKIRTKQDKEDLEKELSVIVTEAKRNLLLELIAKVKQDIDNFKKLGL